MLRLASTSINSLALMMRAAAKAKVWSYRVADQWSVDDDHLENRFETIQSVAKRMHSTIGSNGICGCCARAHTIFSIKWNVFCAFTWFVLFSIMVTTSAILLVVPHSNEPLYVQPIWWNVQRHCSHSAPFVWFIAFSAGMPATVDLFCLHCTFVVSFSFWSTAVINWYYEQTNTGCGYISFGIF